MCLCVGCIAWLCVHVCALVCVAVLLRGSYAAPHSRRPRPLTCCRRCGAGRSGAALCPGPKGSAACTPAGRGAEGVASGAQRRTSGGWLQGQRAWRRLLGLPPLPARPLRHSPTAKGPSRGSPPPPQPINRPGPRCPVDTSHRCCAKVLFLCQHSVAPTRLVGGAGFPTSYRQPVRRWARRLRVRCEWCGPV